MTRPGVVRGGGVALVLGGLFGFAGTALLFSENLLYTTSDSSTIESVYMLFTALSGLVSLAICVGAACAYPIFRNTSDLIRRIAFWSIVLTVTSSGLFVLGTILMLATWNSAGFYIGTLFRLPMLFAVYATPLGFVILGVAALRNRALGFFRFLPLVVGVTLSPLYELLVFYLVRPETVINFYVEETPFEGYMLFEILSMLITDGLTYSGLLLFGVVLFGAEKREERISARERELTETHNLAVARRLYDEVWVKGDAGALEEFVSPEVVDLYHEEVGLANFRRNVAGLRRTFPDLVFRIEEQRAEGDTVITRWSLEGNDEGGVLWFPPTGKRVALNGTFTDRFENVFVVEHRGESDAGSLIEKLGLKPSTEPRSDAGRRPGGP